MQVGIDTLAMATSRYVLDLATLAKARDIDPAKFNTGLGQLAMSVPPPGEDVVTLGANAALAAVRGVKLDDIELVLFATESGIDQSKSAGIYVHELLGLPAHCRVVELKQACYSGTAGLQMALTFVRAYPTKKALVLMADIARYGLITSGESSQGAGAIAMVISANPRILTIEAEFGVVTESVMDFWRPNYTQEAHVDGKYSSKIYLTMLERAFKHYQTRSDRHLADHQHFLYHTPVPRLVEKAHEHLFKNETTVLAAASLQTSLHYSRLMGNSYTASLYVCLLSLLENSTTDLAGQRIGFYSYGSGCVAEYFSGVVQPHYQSMLAADEHRLALSARKPLSYDQYVEFFNFAYNETGLTQLIPLHETGAFRLTKLQQHKRCYEPVMEHCEC